ncbi:MAG: type 4a pilus biogenesis protein PilO [Planctomycetes bacterium]|nr:type 4a pilus biogenesis protein PilO [Planctomycetota bacterium]
MRPLGADLAPLLLSLLAGAPGAYAASRLLAETRRDAAAGARARVEAEALERKAAELSQTRRRAEEAREQLRALEARLPAGPEVEALLEEVASAARASNLEVLRLRPLPTRREGEYLRRDVELALSGRFHDTYAFLGRIEALDRVVRCPMVRIANSPELDGRLSSEVLLTTYQADGPAGEPVSLAEGRSPR